MHHKVIKRGPFLPGGNFFTDKYPCRDLTILMIFTGVDEKIDQGRYRMSGDDGQCIPH